MKKSRYLIICFSLTLWILYSCNSSGTKNYEVSASNQENDSKSSLIALGIECDSESICGAVFVDTDKDLIYSPNDSPIAGVQVTNGKDITITDDKGVFKLPKGFDYVYITKPDGYDLPLAMNNIPVFFRKTEPQQQLYYFSLTPSEATHAYSGVIMNDIHLEVVAGQGQWGANQDPLETFNKFIDEFMNLSPKPDFIIANGDQSGVTPEDTSGLDNYVSACSRLGIPVYNVMGNPGHNDSDSDRVFYKTAYRSYFGPLYHSFDYDDCHFIVLDTNILSGDHGKILTYGLDETQKQWFETDLELNKYKRILVFFHEPIDNTENTIEYIVKKLLKKPPDVWVDRESILELLAKYKVSVVFFGHTHSNGIFKEKGTLHVTNGAVCGAWWGPDFNNIMYIFYSSMSDRGINANADGTPQGYRILTVAPEILSSSYKAFTQERDICFADPAGTRLGYEKLSFTDIDILNAYTFCVYGNVESLKTGVSKLQILKGIIPLTLNAYSLYPIESVAYKIDSGSWVDAMHNGGIIYSAEIDAAKLSPGPHIITARIKDSMGKKDSMIFVVTDSK
jgi:UDP-2,3-diacylglucosamine pyrophosphatase LpxH